jgi:hypothetical protein
MLAGFLSARVGGKILPVSWPRHGMLNEHPQLYTILSAELLLLLTRSTDLLVLCKQSRQRTRLEQQQVDRGLWRGLVLEALLFVPASCILLLLLAPLVLSKTIIAATAVPSATYAAVGVASYGFPFMTIKRIITRVAATTLREFVALVPEESKEASSMPREVK